MGVFTFAFVGGSYIMIGAWESFISHSGNSASSPSLSSSLDSVPPKTLSPRISSDDHKPQFSIISLISTFVLSVLFFFDCLLSVIAAIHHNDKIGATLQLQVLAVSSLFMMFSVMGLLNYFSRSVVFPYTLIDLILLFAFLEEFLLFYLQKKDPSGIENRYFDLMLIPITICIFSTVMELKSPSSNKPRLARGIGLILKGSWLVQMGLSFYSELIAHNCHLIEKSRGNYTIRCKGHMDFHRGRAIAVLLFNCHLASLVAVLSCVYSVVGKRYFGVRNYSHYRPLGAEMLGMVDIQSKFTLDSDEDDNDGIGIDIDTEKRRITTREGGSGEVQLAVKVAPSC